MPSARCVSTRTLRTTMSMSCDEFRDPQALRERRRISSARLVGEIRNLGQDVFAEAGFGFFGGH